MLLSLTILVHYLKRSLSHCSTHQCFMQLLGRPKHVVFIFVTFYVFGSMTSNKRTKTRFSFRPCVSLSTSINVLQQSDNHVFTYFTLTVSFKYSFTFYSFCSWNSIFKQRSIELRSSQELTNIGDADCVFEIDELSILEHNDVISRVRGICVISDFRRRIKETNDPIGNRTRGLPACSAMPPPTASPLTAIVIFLLKN